MNSTLIYSACALICAALLAYTLTPLVRVLAIKIKAIDVPTDGRRMHHKPIPRIGGLAIFLAFLITSIGFCRLDRELVTILIGGSALVLLGILDDVYRLNAFLKLAVQIVAALFAVSQGVTIDYICFFGKYVAFGNWAIPITVFWIVGLTNAVNFIDGLDGLASSVCATVAAFTLLLAVWRRDADSTVLAAALLAGMRGFLVFNHHPAQMFMGDTGSLFLGGVIMGCAMMAGELLLFVLAGFVFVADMLTSLLQRWYFRLTHGKRLFPIAPIHHSFEKWGFGEYAVMGLFAGVSALFCVLAWFGK